MEHVKIGIFEIEGTEELPMNDKLVLFSCLFERESEKIKIENWEEEDDLPY